VFLAQCAAASLALEASEERLAVLNGALAHGHVLL